MIRTTVRSIAKFFNCDVATARDFLTVGERIELTIEYYAETERRIAHNQLKRDFDAQIARA